MLKQLQSCGVYFEERGEAYGGVVQKTLADRVSFSVCYMSGHGSVGGSDAGDSFESNGIHRLV